MNMEVPCGDCNGTGAKGGPAGMQVIFLLNFSQILLKVTLNFLLVIWIRVQERLIPYHSQKVARDLSLAFFML